MIQNWQKKAEKLVYDGYRKMARKTFILPDQREDDYDIQKDGRSVAIVAVLKRDATKPRNDLAEDKVILTGQFRPGPELSLGELPGGAIDPGETAEEAAVRELLEETGYKGRVIRTGTTWASGYSERRKHHVLIVDCEKVTEPKLEPGEFIELNIVSSKEFARHAMGGELTDQDAALWGINVMGWLM